MHAAPRLETRTMMFTLRTISAHAQACLITAALALAGTLGGTASAQPGPLGDPPGRVARLSDVSGQVWLYNPDNGDWVNAVRNRPLTTGDRLATDAGARAEVQVGSSTVRLDAGTELEVRNVDDAHVSLQLHNGSMSARLRDAAEAAEFEVVTEDGRFVVQRTGRYRFDRDTSGSFATVYAGQARYEGPNSGLAIPVGQRAEFWIDANGAAQYRLGEAQNDAFAAWTNERDRSAERSVSARYVSPAMTGAEELDRYGRWEQDPDYGALWIPRGVAVGWAPYSTGHWAWVLPWGWTWVDDAAWGFAPFHYGRWVHRRDVWCWTPGERVVRPIYAPALVGWVGGPGVSVSITIGGGRPPPVVGWFPLAPREVYVPSYRASPRYVQNVNITNVTNITQITNVINNPQAPREFNNRRVQNAVTVVPAAVMTGRQPVAPAAAQLRDTPWVRDIARQPAATTTLVAAPVAAPVLPAAPARGAQARPVSLPPGAAALPAGPPVGGRPGGPAREREARPPAPPITPAIMPATAPATPVAPVSGSPKLRPTPDVETRNGQPAQPVQPQVQPQPAGPGRPLPREERERPAIPVLPSVIAPAVPKPPVNVVPAPPFARPAPPAVPEAPTMRPLPVQRGDERRSAPRPDAVDAAEPRQPSRGERPVPAAKPAEAARPPVAPVAPPAAVPAMVPRAAPPAVLVAPMAVVRPVEAPKPSPQPKQVEPPPRPRSEPAKDVREERREEKRDDKRGESR
jgi:hypothetical protein